MPGSQEAIIGRQQGLVERLRDDPVVMVALAERGIPVSYFFGKVLPGALRRVNLLTVEHALTRGFGRRDDDYFLVYAALVMMAQQPKPGEAEEFETSLVWVRISSFIGQNKGVLELPGDKEKPWLVARDVFPPKTIVENVLSRFVGMGMLERKKYESEGELLYYYRPIGEFAEVSGYNQRLYKA